MVKEEATPFARRLRAGLRSMRLTQADLAARMGVSQQTVSKWMIGETVPRPRHVPVLADILEVDLAELSTLMVTGNKEAIASATGESDVHDVRLAALDRRLRSLSADELDRVEAYVRGLFDARR